MTEPLQIAAILANLPARHSSRAPPPDEPSLVKTVSWQPMLTIFWQQLDLKKNGSEKFLVGRLSARWRVGSIIGHRKNPARRHNRTGHGTTIPTP
jgi:hypothetical protein